MSDNTRFIHVVPYDWGPFVDIRACLQSLSRRRPRTQVIPQDWYRRDPGLWEDPECLFICWDISTADPGPKENRKCKVAVVYSEAIDENQANLLPQHRAVWDSFLKMAPNLDAVLTHTPRTAEILGKILPAYVLPVGWDAEAMGALRHAPKHQQLVYHGSMAGRRALIVPYLIGRLGLVDITGSCGRQLLGRRVTAAASLYIAHSPVESFSTWRLWQAASTSAALIAEPGDTWPFEKGKHFLGIPRISVDNAEDVSLQIIRYLEQKDRLIEIANAAHELARQFTVGYVEDEFLVPAVNAMRGVS